ncbi:L-arabinokinase isoform X1 [Iris pallida]|uniref:L-arabinokinase isoform X1 n=1 Tax=Iris pallida TaxID=29817 RepID=A0AAX6HXT1_IRIPA|nr:L-arabinokinase isoform X1 [Iris pallida]KAJ6829549.1 L-arabinokinase isoform X1 [Iris pallida]KAJ6845732.1 L-arabinokinase isoform X1 [Iris pallida]
METCSSPTTSKRVGSGFCSTDNNGLLSRWTRWKSYTKCAKWSLKIDRHQDRSCICN